MQNLMGRTWYLWERNIALQLQARALTEEWEGLVRCQTTNLETTLGLHVKVAELRRERDQLKQQADLRAEPPATATNPASIASEVRRTAREWKATADRLKADADRIRIERGQLQDRVKELQATYQQKAEDLTRDYGTIDIFQEQMRHLKPTAQPVSSAPQAFATPMGGNLPTHQEMGGHVRRPLVSNPATLLATTPELHAMPPAMTPVRSHVPRSLGTDTPTLPQLTPQSSTSLAVPPCPEPDQEERVDSESQQ